MFNLTSTANIAGEEKMETCSCKRAKAIWFCSKEPPCNGQLVYCMLCYKENKTHNKKEESEMVTDVFVERVTDWSKEIFEKAIAIHHDFSSYFQKVKPILHYLQAAADKLGKQPEKNLIKMGKDFLRLYD